MRAHGFVVFFVKASQYKDFFFKVKKHTPLQKGVSVPV